MIEIKKMLQVRLIYKMYIKLLKDQNLSLTAYLVQKKLKILLIKNFLMQWIKDLFTLIQEEE